LADVSIAINFLLVAFLLGAYKKKLHPYVGAGILGVIKGVLYAMGSGSVVVACLAMVVFAGLAAAMVYFLARVGKKEDTEEHFSKYGYIKKGRFKWETIPLCLVVFLVVFGEFTLTIMFS
jgi:heme/copper-type cytochrome/quinol oxidase subunit 2